MAAKFSPEARASALTIIQEENLNTCAKIVQRFKVSEATALNWLNRSGIERKCGYRTLDLPEETGFLKKTGVSEGSQKESRFVEPDPGMDSFKSDKEAANYYRLRAEYLENLYMLADSPTDVKKKALRLLEERVRERMREEQT